MEFAERVQNIYNNASLAHFIDENIDTFFENKVSSSSEHKIPEGMKLIKAFKFFESDKVALRDIQDLASQLIQENKIKGTLCFSVHPLDFLSSSENTYNWRSCHALDGEFRAGNLSYMVDETTFMVYIKGADDVYLNNFGEVKWNSKKWRMLIHAATDDEIMFAGRQYPFSSTSGLDQVLNIYNNLMIDGFNRSYYAPYHKYHSWRADYVDSYVPHNAPIDAEPRELDERYLVYGNKLIGISEIVKPGYNAMNYNDILGSTCYTYPYYTVLNTYGYHSVKRMRENPIIVGGEVMCLHCGDEPITIAETMRCDDCEVNYGYEETDTYGSCQNCGARIYLDDAPCVGDYDELVCEHCYEHCCFVCDECGTAQYNEEKTFIKFDNGSEGYVCRHCYERLTRKEGDY